MGRISRPIWQPWLPDWAGKPNMATQCVGGVAHETCLIRNTGEKNRKERLRTNLLRRDKYNEPKEPGIAALFQRPSVLPTNRESLSRCRSITSSICGLARVSALGERYPEPALLLAPPSLAWRNLMLLNRGFGAGMALNQRSQEVDVCSGRDSILDPWSIGQTHQGLPKKVTCFHK